MRHSLLLVAVTAALAGVTVFACSSDDTATIASPDAGDGFMPDDGTSGNNGTSGDDGTLGDNGTSGDPANLDDGGKKGDGGGNNNTGGGNPGVDSGQPIDGGSAGSKCFEDSVKESEDNDTAGKADPIPNDSGTFCGRISSADDVDYFKFTLPATATSFAFTQSNTNAGAIKIDATADGTAFDFNGTYPIKPGKPYVLKISTSGAVFDYGFSVSIKCGDAGTCP